jgi:hypothetical protein
VQSGIAKNLRFGSFIGGFSNDLALLGFASGAGVYGNNAHPIASPKAHASSELRRRAIFMICKLAKPALRVDSFDPFAQQEIGRDRRQAE